MNQSSWDTLPLNYPITKKGIYLKNASMAGIHKDILDSVNTTTTAMAQQGLCDESLYREAYKRAHLVAAKFLGVSDQAIALTSSTSYNMNIFAMMMKIKGKGKGEGKGDERPRQNIISHSDEFPSTILPFSHHGYEIRKLTTKLGQYEPMALLDLVDSHTSAVVLSTVVSTTGFRAKLEQLASELHKRNIPLILNATQSLGFFDIDLNSLKVSAMSASTHKSIGSIVGLSLAYMSDEFRKRSPSPLMGWASAKNPGTLSIEKQDPRSDANSIELGSMPFSHLAAFEKALSIHNEIPIEEKSKHLLALTANLRIGLKKLGIEVFLNDQSETLSSITTFICEDPEKIKKLLEEKGIFLNIKRGHLRASFGLFNTQSDVLNFLDALALAIKQ
jgi:selenocysteine lyase/cysteine desulfurase